MASIRKRGNSYQITVSNGRRADGSQIIETTTFVPDPDKTERQNQKSLERFVIEFEDKVKSGKYLDGEKMTFRTFIEIWRTDYAEMQLGENTRSLYLNLLERHILPEIGHLKLSKIQPLHLNKLYNKLSQERKDGKLGGYAPKTIKHVRDVISCIYTAAGEWNIVTENPCDRAKVPKQTPARDQIKFFTLEQAEIFLSLLDKDYTTPYKAHDRLDDTGIVYHVSEYSETRRISKQLKLFYLFALYCGMRRGEIIALEWSDLDFERNAVQITKSTCVVNGKPLTKAPKTATSNRTIAVPAFIMDLAKQYRKEQLQYRMTIGSQWEGDNFVFIQWNGKQMYPSTPYNAFKKIIRRHNAQAPDSEKLPDIPLHGLRHTSATLLISQNVDVRTVSARLGHAQASTTMDIYSHALQNMDEKAAGALDGLLGKKKEKQTLVKC